MHFDALTLACVTSELNAAFCPGRIQQILLVADHAIGLEVYTQRERHQLLLWLDAGLARMHEVSYKLRRGVEGETPFLLLLRKYTRGALLTRIEQPDPTERVVHLHIDHIEHGATSLICEFIGRQPNAILLNPQGRILECLHRMPASATGRVILPGRTYAPPPALTRVAPVDDGSETYYTQLEQVLKLPGPLWKALVAGIAGMSPTAAREVAWHAAGNVDAATTGVTILAVIQALQALWAPLGNGAWQPGLLEEESRVVAFAAYPLHGRGTFAATTTISAALERYAADRAAAPVTDPYASQRGQVRALVQRARQQTTRRLAALASDEPAPGVADLLRTQAQWLLALNHQVQPSQRVLEVDTGSEMLEIPLDPHYSAVEQAQRMFKRAAKLDRAAIAIPLRRADLLADQELLAQLELDLSQANNQPELAAVVEELRTAGFVRTASPRTRHGKTPTAGPLRYRTRQGVEIIAGRNARQNEQVTFRLAQPADLWLHARGAPGAHVIVRTSGRPPTETDIEEAARLAAYHSSARGDRSVDVIVSEKRWVSRAPGGRPGQVLVARERVIAVPGDAPEGLEAIA